jgi:hypothetical protein
VADSLRLCNLFELLGGGVPSQLTMCAGAVFRLGNAYDFGSPQPVVDFVATLTGDGERPFGWRYSNRTLTLPLVIIVPSTGSPAADRLTLAGAREALMQAVSADSFDLVWAPDGSDGTLNTVFECWKAKASTISYDIKQERQLVSELSVTFDAMPFGRSDTLSSLNFDSPVAGVTPPLAQNVVDDYTSFSTTTQGTWWTTSPVTAYGTASARWHHDLSDDKSPLLYTHTLSPAENITGLNKVTFWFGLGADTNERYRGWKSGLVHFVVILRDNLSRTLTFSVQQVCRASSNNNWPVWNRVSLPVPQGSSAFTYSNVVAYSVKAWSDVRTLTSGKFTVLRHTGYLAGLIATPTAAPRRPASDRGGDYLLYGIEGTAPTPLNLHLQLGFQQLVPATQTVTLQGAPGAALTYTAPAENPNWLYGDTADGERGTTGTWTGSDGAAANATVTNSTTLAHSGTHAIRVVPASGGTSAVIASCPASVISSAGVPCQPGDRIALRTWARAGSTGRSITVAAEFYNSGGTSTGTQALSAVTDSSGSWTQINGRVTAPANAAFCRMLITTATPATSEIHYFDDIYLSRAVQATVIGVGAGGAGGSTAPSNVSAQGGGGGEIAWETNLDLNPGAGHAYVIGKGGVPAQSGSNGGAGGDSTFAGLSATVTANGGGGGLNELTADNVDAPAGTNKGTGSSNAHHFDGGNGGAGTSPGTLLWAGGGGGAASDGGAGAAGGSPAGGAGGNTGALGVQGGQGSAGNTAATGYFPGGGGGGATSGSVNAHPGSAGANGMIKMIITTFTAKQTFPCALVHKLSPRSGIRAKAVVPVGAGQDPPDGREYTVDAADGQPARYQGTYSLLLVNFSWNGTANRTVTATVRQHEAAGGAVSAVALAQPAAPANVPNGMLWLGEVTLPLKDMPAENTDSYFTVAVNSGNSADRFLDLLLIDTQGQLIVVNLPGSGYTDYYFDAPDLSRDLGLVLGTMTDRSAAVSVAANTFMSGGPMRLLPGDNVFTVYSPTGMPGLEGDYWPRWWHERLS